MQLKCIVIDDEPWAFELIKKYVSKIPFLKLAQTLCDIKEANEFLQSNQVDLLFIDVNIPTGIDLLSSLVNKPITIFTTAYKKYALKGFEFGALDYLLKPLDFERFSKAAGRAFELYKYMQYSKHSDADYMFVRSGYKMVKIQLNEIEYIEGFVDYIRIHIINDKPVLTLMTLKCMIEKLPSDKFKRIHRSYIVPISQIKELQNKKLLLFSLKELPISGSYVGFNKDLNKL
jgi:two-component system, LytTR family, response regulator